MVCDKSSFESGVAEWARKVEREWDLRHKKITDIAFHL